MGATSEPGAPLRVRQVYGSARPERRPVRRQQRRLATPIPRRLSPPIMDCRTFREHHGAFLDDLLSGADTVAMERHRTECRCCSAFDVRVRRGLMVLHSLPSVQCSEGFNERLRERLRGVQQEVGSDLGRPRWVVWHRSRPGGQDPAPGMRSFAFAAVAVLSISAGAYALLPVDHGPVVLPPVVATRPAPEPELLASPAIVVSSFAGAPVWPAMLLADEMPMRVAEVGFQLTSMER